MQGFDSRFVAAVLGGALTPVSLVAQIDYRNLDDRRPSKVADAYPIERFAFELSIPYRISWNERFAHTVAPELAYGIARSIAVGAQATVTPQGNPDPDGPDTRAGLWIFGNLRRETPGAPAISFRLDWSAPLDVGGLSRSSLSLTGLGTRSIGRSRVHLNAGWRVASPNDPSLVSEGDWWLGVAVDHTLFRTSTLVVADLVLARTPMERNLALDAEVGLRRQLAPTLVLAAGVGRSWEPGEQRTEVTVGLSHAFAIAGLMRGRVR